MLIPNKLNITYTAAMPDGRRFTETAQSNTVTTEILSYALLKEIRCDKTLVNVGETVCNYVTVTNNSTAKLLGNVFKISQPEGATLVAGSVKVNGVAQPTYDPVKGFTIGDLQPGETVVIEYEIKAHKPTTSPVTHFANLQFTVNDPVRGSVNYSENTDTLSVNILYEKNDKAAKIVIYNPYGSGLNDCEQVGCDCCRNCCRCCCDCLSYYDLCNFYGGYYC